MSIAELVSRWALAFAITQLVECVVYVRGFRLQGWVAFGASAITHPIVVFLIPGAFDRAYLAVVGRWPGAALGDRAYFVGYGAIAEGFAIAAEALWLSLVGRVAASQVTAGPTPAAAMARLHWRTCLLASLIANACSAGLGGALSWATGWP